MSAAKILVIDDSVPDIEMLRFGLNQQGEAFELKILSDGEAALVFIREHRAGSLEPEPCVILLDLNLPRHNGLTVLRAIRDTPALNHIQVMILSGGGSPRDLAEIDRLGGLFRQKPMGISEFIELSREILAVCKGETAELV